MTDYMGKSNTIYEVCPVCGKTIEIDWFWKEYTDGFRFEEGVRMDHEPFGSFCGDCNSITGYRTVGCCGICKYFSRNYSVCNHSDYNNIIVGGEIKRAMDRIYHDESWTSRPSGIRVQANGWCPHFRDKNDNL